MSPVTSQLVPYGATFATQSCSRIMREQGCCKLLYKRAARHIEDRQGALYDEAGSEKRSTIGVRRRTGTMSASAHERRPSQWTAASRFPLSPDSDRGRVVAAI